MAEMTDLFLSLWRRFLALFNKSIPEETIMETIVTPPPVPMPLSGPVTPVAGSAYVCVVEGRKKHYIKAADFEALDKVSPGAQARLSFAAEFVVDVYGELAKSKQSAELFVEELLVLRSGGSTAKPAGLPADVLAALAALNAAVARAG